VRGWPAVIAKVAEALAQSRLGLSKPPSGALT
jgi:hypothetical protein